MVDFFLYVMFMMGIFGFKGGLIWGEVGFKSGIFVIWVTQYKTWRQLSCYFLHSLGNCCYRRYGANCNAELTIISRPHDSDRDSGKIDQSND